MSIERQAGMTLVELVIAIVIIGVGLAGVLSAFSVVVKSSADPLIQKQALAIAEEMMEEITLKPFAVSGTAPVNVARNCTSGAGTAPRTSFDDVSDYNNYETTGICNIDGDAIGGLASYGIKVAVNNTSLGGVSNAKRITVTVFHGGRTAMQLAGWRVDYAVNLN